MTSKALSVFAMLLVVALFLSGCGRDNGLPSDLINHLAQHGITITPTQSHAPLSSRGGYVVARHDPVIASNLVTTFNLRKIDRDDQLWGWVIDHAGGVTAVKEMWAIFGRPVQFKLRNGGQFEYFCLIIAEDGMMYLLAEYAYG